MLNDLEALEVFASLCTTGSIQKTAQALGIDPELRVTCSTFRIAAVVQKAGAIQNSADARQEYCS